jgi:methionine sulfoxide reductase heme-binding subunit
MSTGHHLFWITSRAAGTAALVTASLSVAFGILLSRRRTSSEMSSGDRRALHEALSLMTLGLIGLHGAALLGDSFLRPGLAGIAIPFVGPYRPTWTAFGIIAGYGLAALGLSYYWRDRIGPGRWRQVHRFTALFWLLGVVHSLGSGSDAYSAWFLLIAGLAVVPAAILLVGRVGHGLGQVLDLPRRESPLREAP